MQTLREEPSSRSGPTRSGPTPAEIRETLLASARRAGSGFVHVRGVDLVAALTGTIPDDWEPTTR